MEVNALYHRTDLLSLKTPFEEKMNFKFSNRFNQCLGSNNHKVYALGSTDLDLHFVSIEVGETQARSIANLGTFFD